MDLTTLPVPVDERADLTDTMLTLDDFPLAGFRVFDSAVLPVPDQPSAAPTLSQGTSRSTTEPTTLCDDGDLSAILGLDEASGARTAFVRSGSYPESPFLEVLLDDESGHLAETVRNQLEECISAGPIVTEFSTDGYGWTDVDVPAVEGVFTAEFRKSLDVSAVSVGHVDGRTLITSSELIALRVVLEPEEYAAATHAAYEKLAR